MLAVIAVVGATKLTQPFFGDQALFMVGAREIGHGAVLYRDFWDIKQPAIFLYYLLAGAVGGYNEVSVHALELVTLVGFSLVLQQTGRRLVRVRWVASVLPLFVVGVFYAGARPWELTQIEGMIGFPLYVSVWLALRSLDPGDRRARLVGSGVAAGVAVLFKWVCLPLVAPAWIVAIVVDARRRRDGRVRRGMGTVAWITFGIALPLAPFVLYFAAHGLLGEIGWTYVVYTPKTTGIAGRPLSRLVDGVTRFVALSAPVMLLAALGLVQAVRSHRDRWSLAFAGWIALAVPVTLTQHWWPYQMAVFAVPVAFFGARGLEVVAHSWRRLASRARVAIVFVLTLSAVPAGLTLAKATVRSAGHGFGVTAPERRALQNQAEPQYRTGRAFARFVDEHTRPGQPVYVLGNPIDLYLSGRDQAIPTNGWAAEQYDAKVWHRITDGLATKRPVVLAVDDFSMEKMKERSPATLAVVERLYCPVHRTGGETWYVLRASDAACPALPR
ncbi:MAG TPA: hypothetical protein VIB48_15775 [Acidimicrobiia bacterium]